MNSHEQWIQSFVRSDEHIASDFKWLRAKLKRLAPVHQATLRLIIEHLARIAAHCSANKMDPKNLSIVFGTVLFGEDEIPKDANVLTLAQMKVKDPMHRTCLKADLASRIPYWRT